MSYGKALTEHGAFSMVAAAYAITTTPSYDKGTAHTIEKTAGKDKMATRSLAASGSPHSQTKKPSQKLALGDLPQAYLPVQPVLSGRTVNIDLPGTRSHRHKSTLDLIEEQRRLIRHLYTKPRVVASAPHRLRTILTPRSSSVANTGGLNIEVRGRPLTSRASVSVSHKENKTPAEGQRRPKTAGQLKHVLPLTDCHRTLSEVRDLLAISHSSQKLNSKLHSYWNSDGNTLAVGKFIRGQKGLDAAFPTLDSWLTFGGATGAMRHGVIDAFTNLRNSEEYYNIEGSVGNRIAHQLQKGDVIRIGINGVLQKQDLKVRKRCNTTVPELKTEASINENHQHIVTGENDGPILESTTNVAEKEVDLREESAFAEEGSKKDEDMTSLQATRRSSETDFGELVLSEFEDFQEDTRDMDTQKLKTPANEGTSVGTLLEATTPEDNDNKAEDDDADENEVEESVKETTPLSWSDLCAKADVKILQPNLSLAESAKPVVSETIPVKFQKLTDASIRPKLLDVKSEGFKIKHRSLSEIYNTKDNSAKVKVLYIDPLTTDDDEVIKGLSIDSIINHQLDRKTRANTNFSISNGVTDYNHEGTIASAVEDKVQPLHPVISSNPRSNSSNSLNSFLTDRRSIYSPKLKVNPVHSSAGCKGENLRITCVSTGQNPVRKDGPRFGKIPGKLVPARPNNCAGQGCHVKKGRQKIETEYIKIISQLKITPSGQGTANLLEHSAVHASDQLSVGRNSPEDVNYLSVSDQDLNVSKATDGDILNVTGMQIGSVTESLSVLSKESSHKENEIVNREIYSKDVKAPAGTTSSMGILTGSEAIKSSSEIITGPATTTSPLGTLTSPALTTFSLGTLIGPEATTSHLGILAAPAGTTSGVGFSMTTAAAISIPTAEEELFIYSHTQSKIMEDSTYHN